MALVNSDYQFIWGSCGFLGNFHDSVIFQSTNVWNSIQEGMVGKVNIPPLIIADSAFPLRTWLMKPYADAVFSGSISITD